MVFPEGTRTSSGRLQRFKEGVARLSIKTGVPVVPTIIKGGFETLPKGELFPKSGILTIRFLKPIYPEHYVSSAALNSDLRRLIEDGLK